MGHHNMLCMCREVYQQLVVIFVPPLTVHISMATESGARHRDNQNAFRITDVKKRKKLLGKVLKFPEFNEEDDWRLGILLDIH